MGVENGGCTSILRFPHPYEPRIENFCWDRIGLLKAGVLMDEKRMKLSGYRYV